MENAQPETRNPNPGTADLHIHTCHDGWGDGNDTVAEIFDFVQEQTDLTLIALTDHDSTDAGRAGREVYPSKTYRFDFLPGTEVTTTSGHVLCYFPGEIVDVPSLRSLSWTTAFVHDRQGFCILAHPVYPPWLRRSVSKPRSRTIRMVDAIEVINGGLSTAAQGKLDDIAATLDTRAPLVGNSDSHHKESIGSVFTEYPGRSMADFQAALGARATRPAYGAPAPMPREARSFTRRRSMTRPGWVRNVYREVAGGRAEK
jgi:predicted metal-dependent phosphoesterase TrpH